MFARVKPVGTCRYLQVAENYLENGKTRQRIIAVLGRLGRLQESGEKPCCRGGAAEGADERRK